MYFMKVILHNVYFIVLCVCIYLFSELGLLFTIMSTPPAYIAGYFLSKWTFKLLCLCVKVKSENKCVLITGCASGFGYQTAIKLNKLGFKVFATCRDPNVDGARRLIEVAAYPNKMIVLGMDVTKDNEIDSTYETVVKSMTSSECLFGLVNNAGITSTSEFEFGRDLNDCKRIIDVDLVGMISVTRKFLPLIRQCKGRIVNVESLGGLFPVPFSIFYSTAKSGAMSFSDNLRFSMYKFGVTVVSIIPWFYKTKMTDSATLTSNFENSYNNSPEEVRRAYGAKFVEKVMKAMKYRLDKGTTESNDAPNSIVSALISYEPDPRYIVCPFQWEMLVRATLWISKDSFEVGSQIVAWVYGIDKAYPEMDGQS